MLLLEVSPLKLRTVWSDSFSDVSSFCITCVYNECHQKNQSRRSKMGLTSHLSDAYDAFSSSCFSFSFLLSPMKISLTNLTMEVLGPGSPPVHALFPFSLKIPLVKWVAQNPLVLWVAQIHWSCQWKVFRWLCQWNIKCWSNRRIDLNWRIDSTIRIDSTLRIDSTVRIDSTDILIWSSHLI